MAVITLKCPNCGGELVFDPASQRYVCEYCGSAFLQQQLGQAWPDAPAQGQPVAEEADTGAAEGDASSAALFSCPSCGAQIVTESTTAATFCYYCHNPVVLTGRVSGDFLPDRIIPFQITREQAKERIASFIRSKRFVPRAFFSEEQIEKLSGVYYPYWCYDSEIEAHVDAKGNKVRVWRSGDQEFTETSVYQLRRGGTITQKDLMRNALKASDKELVENVQPFDLSQVQPFTIHYLSGFLAEKRDIEHAELQEIFQKQVEDHAQKMVQSSMSGYHGVTIQSSSFRRRKETWKYVLLPVWVLTYQSKGKTYYYAMNGQTGLVCGRLPVDYGKLGVFAGILGGIAMAILMAVGYLL